MRSTRTPSRDLASQNSGFSLKLYREVPHHSEIPDYFDVDIDCFNVGFVIREHPQFNFVLLTTTSLRLWAEENPGTLLFQIMDTPGGGGVSIKSRTSHSTYTLLYRYG